MLHQATYQFSHWLNYRCIKFGTDYTSDYLTPRSLDKLLTLFWKWSLKLELLFFFPTASTKFRARVVFLYELPSPLHCPDPYPYRSPSRHLCPVIITVCSQPSWWLVSSLKTITLKKVFIEPGRVLIFVRPCHMVDGVQSELIGRQEWAVLTGAGSRDAMWAQDGHVSLHGAHRPGKAALPGGLILQPTPTPNSISCISVGWEALISVDRNERNNGMRILCLLLYHMHRDYSKRSLTE